MKYRDIAIDKYGDLESNYSGTTKEIENADVLYQMFYLAVKTHINTWSGCPNIGSTLSLRRGKILNNVLADLAINDINEAIERHPVLQQYKIELELISVVRDTIKAKVRIENIGISSENTVIIDPYNNVFKYVTPLDIDKSVLDKVKRDDYIINSGKFKK